MMRLIKKMVSILKPKYRCECGFVTTSPGMIHLHKVSRHSDMGTLDFATRRVSWH